MDLRILVLVSALFIQGFNAAAVEVPTEAINGTPLESVSGMTSEDAKVLAELERLRTSGEQFQKDAMKFVQSLPNRLSDGFSQSHQLFKLLAQMFSSAVNKQLGSIMENLENGRKRISENAGKLASEGLRRGQEALEEIRKNGNALIQNGMSYAGSVRPQTLQTRSLPEALSIPKPLAAAKPLRNPKDFREEIEDNSEELEDYEDEEQEEESAGSQKPQKLATREDQSVSGVLNDQLGQVGAASTDALKHVTTFTTGGIRGLLDALSAVLATGTEIGGHARESISGIRKSATKTLGTAIDTGGNIVAGGLDKTGSIIESMRVGGAAATANAPTPKTR